ncbi:MAG: tripartite tricarboxylate transporter substrate binding protein, partial [Proteobacteria bacterium]|nr:tripartite tricarboxylate transporter substrate binding protein [Burkholderiales bacterium]
MTTNIRRALLAASIAVFTASFAWAGATAHAQGFPTRPITLIVPWTAGGSTDIAVRSLAASASKTLGQPMIIENRPGAGGTLGPAAMAAARPDGYTLSQMPISLFRIPHMQKVAFDP